MSFVILTIKFSLSYLDIYLKKTRIPHFVTEINSETILVIRTFPFKKVFSINILHTNYMYKKSETVVSLFLLPLVFSNEWQQRHDTSALDSGRNFTLVLC